MAVALGQNDQQLGEILAALTAPDTTRIKQAEDALKPVLKRPESVGLLTTQVSRSENPAVRQIAAVILRKKIGAISASRRVEAPSRHRRDSCPSHNEVGGLFFDFEAVRTESSDRDAPHRWRPSV